MTKAHIAYIIFKLFKNRIQGEDIKCENIKKNLTMVCILLGLFELSKNSVPLFETGYFKSGAMANVNEALTKALVFLRPQIIPLVESFAQPDEFICSSIGNYYGDIYE